MSELEAARKQGSLTSLAELAHNNPALADKASFLAFEHALKTGEVKQFEQLFDDDLAYASLARDVIEVRRLRAAGVDDYVRGSSGSPFTAHNARFAKGRKHSDQRVMANARSILAKSPLTREWKVEVLGYTDRNIYIHVTAPPIGQRYQRAQDGTDSFAGIANTGEAAMNARQQACELLERRINDLETCVCAYDAERPWFVYPRAVAAQMVYEEFYAAALDDDADIGQALRLLSQMTEQAEFEDSLYAVDAEEAGEMAAIEYWRLGFESLAAATLIDVVSRRSPRTRSPHSKAENLLSKRPGPVQDPRIEAALRAYTRFGAERKNGGWVDADTL